MTDGHILPIPGLNHISVCICTYKRPQLLKKLLLALDGQRTNKLFTFSAVVVDNDCAGSAREIVTLVENLVKYRIEYYTEPRQNIALARNKAVLNARGDLIAMIDDDEIPTQEWLLGLINTLLSTGADGVLGPVRPAYPPEAPVWLKKSGLCERPSFPTNTVFTIKHPSRSGNALLRRRVFNNGRNLFEEKYGRTGGEDKNFFDNRIEEGFVFVWCEEAPVYEVVLTERLKLSFYLKRLSLNGGLTGQLMRNRALPFWRNMIISACLTAIYPIILLVCAFIGKHILARHLAKFVYHLSRLLGGIGIMVIRER